MTNKHLPSSLETAVIGHAVFAGLLALAYVFANERVLFVDTAFMLYQLIQDGGFVTYNQRYAAALPQLLPKLGIGLHLPLWALVKLMSVCFVLLHWACFTLILHAVKHKAAAMAWVLVATVLTSQVFYWPQSELQQGLPAMLLLFAIIGRYDFGRRKPILWVITAMLTIAVIFYHPLLIFGFAFISVYYYLRGNAKIQKTTLAVFIFGMAVYVVRLFTITKNPYEAGKFGALKQISLQKILHYFELPSVSFFLKNLFGNYFGFLVLLLAVLFFLVRQKQFKILALVLVSTIGYWAFLSLSFTHAPGPNLFYRENMLRILSLFVCIPFAYQVLPHITKTAWRLAFMLALLAINFVVIYKSHEFFSQRLDWLQQTLASTKQLPETAFFVHAEQLPPSLAETWSLPYETLLLSSLKKSGNIRSLTVYDANKASHQKALKEPGYFVQPWRTDKCSKLNSRYFKHPCSKYRIINLPPSIKK